MLNKIKLGPKLISGFVIVALIAAIIGIISFINLKEIGIVRLQSIWGLEKIYANMNNIRMVERTLLIPGIDDKTKQNQIERLSKSWQELDKGWKIYEPLPQTKEEAVLWKQFVPAFEDWKKVNSEIVSLAENNNLADAQTLSFSDGREKYNKVQEILIKLVELNKEVADSRIKSSNTVVISVSIIGFIVAVTLGILLTFSITRPVSQMVDVANKLAEG
ncbi:MAG: MCP four helix bundle domain-containing protein, partial [bacterium]